MTPYPLNLITTISLPAGVDQATMRTALSLLRRSAVRGRSMSLPNLLRLYQRNCRDASAQDLLWLRQIYIALQPIDHTSIEPLTQMIAHIRHGRLDG